MDKSVDCKCVSVNEQQMGLRLHAEQGYESVCDVLITRDELKELAEEDQQKLVEHLRMDGECVDDVDIVGAICGWSGLIPGGEVQQQHLTAANWAMQRGGKIGVSDRDYGQWLECWRKLIEDRRGVTSLSFSEESEKKDMWHWLNTKMGDTNTIENAKIGGNSGYRCWFLCILYFLIGESHFMDHIRDIDTVADGQRLLAKILLSLKIAVMEQNRVALKMITGFVEAFLQGHYCYWDEFGCLETGFRILGRMAPWLMGEFSVTFKMWCKCKSHGEYRSRSLEARRLCLNFPWDWDFHTGDITCHTAGQYQCYRGGYCDTVVPDRMYSVTSDIKRSFMIQFEHGMPLVLWQRIMKGELIWFGAEKRQIGGAIFLVNGNHFVAASLLFSPGDNPHNNRIWVQMDTLKGSVVKFSHAQPEDCRVIFVHAPEKSCVSPDCDDYDSLYMVQCPRCDHWIHNSCAGLRQSALVWDGRGCPECEGE